jgi:hypothetical protein
MRGMKVKAGLIRFVLGPFFFLVGVAAAYGSVRHPQDIKVLGSVKAAGICVPAVLAILSLGGVFAVFSPRVGRLLLLVASLAISLLLWVVEMPGGGFVERAVGSALYVFLGVWLYRELGPEHARRA